MISDQLVLGLLVHALKRVEGTLEVTLEGAEGLDDGVHDSESLLLGEGGAEREVGEVSADSDSGGHDHSGVLLGEGGSVELGGIHVGDVLGILAVLVVLLNDAIEEGSEDPVAVVRARVAADAGVGVLAAGEDGLTEGEAVLVLLVLEREPDLLGKAFHEERLRAVGEHGEVLDVLGLHKSRGDSGRLTVVELCHVYCVFTS